MASRITASVVAAEEVEWGTSGETFLSLSFGRMWQETLNDTGTGEVSVANDDPILATLTYDDAVRFYLDGAPVFTMLVEGIDTQAIHPTEEAQEITKISGRGAGAMLDESVVYPEGGVGHLPVGDDRLFFFGQTPYDDSGWQAATVMATYADTTPNWVSLEGVKAPAGFPDPAAGYIWNNLGTVDDAPEGTVYFRGAFTLPAALEIRIYASADNEWELWLDGTSIMVGDEATTWLNTHQTEVMRLSAGSHMLAARVLNGPPYVDDDGAHPNPAFFMAAVVTVNGADGSETPVFHTDGSWRVTNYLTNAPPVTAGEIMRILFDEAEARGCILPDVTFSDTNDSDGSAWGSTGTAGGPIYEFTVPIGDTYLNVFRSLSDTYIDYRCRYGSFILDVWNKSARTFSSPAVLISGYTASNGNLTELRFIGDGSSIRDVAVVKYQGGFFEHARTAHGRRRREITASMSVTTQGEARQVTDTLLVVLRDAQETTTVAVEVPLSSTWQFYADVLIGDLVTVPDRTGAPVEARLVGMTVTEDTEGNPVFAPELDGGHTAGDL
jgi:hypothetical protein